MSEPRPRSESELVEFVRSSDVRAPDELHRRVDALIDARSEHPRRRPSTGGGARSGRSRLGLGLAGAIAAAAVVALAIVLGQGGGGPPRSPCARPRR